MHSSVLKALKNIVNADSLLIVITIMLGNNYGVVATAVIAIKTSCNYNLTLVSIVIIIIYIIYLLSRIIEPTCLNCFDFLSLCLLAAIPTHIRKPAKKPRF